MPLVLDASIVLAWIFEDDQSAAAEAIVLSLESDQGHAPAIWPVEIANAISTQERRGRLSASGVGEAVALCLGLPVRVHEATAATALGGVLDLARSERLTAYDAAYLELSRRQGFPLASLDDALRRAATRLGVAVLP